MKFANYSEVKLQAAAVILAGGSGTRMGGLRKTELTLNGKTFLERNVWIAAQMFSEIIISVAMGGSLPDSLDYDTLGIPVRVVFDESEGHGPLMGMYSALKGSNFDVNFVTTVDSPFINIPLAGHLTREIGEYDGHVPFWNGYREPLFAVYKKSCTPFIQESIKKNKRKTISFYDKISIKYADSGTVMKYDPEGASFININTHEDYRNLQDSMYPHS